MAKKTIRIAVDPDMPPFSSCSATGCEGFEADFAKKLGKGIVGSDGKVEIHHYKMADVFNALQSDKIDVIIQTVSKTKEREKIVDFAMPYFSIAGGLLVKKNSPIKDPADLKDITIAVEKGTTEEEYFKLKGNVKLVYATSSSDAYKMVKNGEVDGYASDNLIVLAYPIFDDSVEVPKGLRNIGAVEYLAPVVSKGNNELKDAVNKVMIKFSKEKLFRHMYEDNIGIFYRNTLNPNQFLLEELYRMYG